MTLLLATLSYFCIGLAIATCYKHYYDTGDFFDPFGGLLILLWLPLLPAILAISIGLFIYKLIPVKHKKR